VDWSPPDRLAVTWRIGPNWRPFFDDEQASVIEVDFTAARDRGRADLHAVAPARRVRRCPQLVLAGPDPGQTLLQCAEVGGASR
jgi:hypothetical protein